MKKTAIALAFGFALASCGRSVPVHRFTAPATRSITPPAPAKSIVAAPANVYASSMSGKIPTRLAGLPPRVYVPNSTASSVDVIDPLTMKIVDHFAVGVVPHHIFPSYDMATLYVGNTASNTLTQIDIHTGRPVRTIPVTDPYNMYWTFDGPTKAMVIAERFNRIDFRDPVTFKLIKSVAIPSAGVDHGDFTADGRYWLGSTEYNGVLVKVDVVDMKLVSTMNVGGLPVDVRLSPDGKVFYVANQGRHGVSVVDPIAMKELAFIPTGRGAHGFQVSRDTRSLFVSNRLGGTISVIDYASRRVRATWNTGGSPDMMQLSPDGKQLWVSGRFNSAVYVINTSTGNLIKTFHVGSEAHGLTYFPNAGTFCTGHNGVYR